MADQEMKFRVSGDDDITSLMEAVRARFEATKEAVEQTTVRFQELSPAATQALEATQNVPPGPGPDQLATVLERLSAQLDAIREHAASAAQEVERGGEAAEESAKHTSLLHEGLERLHGVFDVAKEGASRMWDAILGPVGMLKDLVGFLRDC